MSQTAHLSFAAFGFLAGVLLAVFIMRLRTAGLITQATATLRESLARSNAEHQAARDAQGRAETHLQDELRQRQSVEASLGQARTELAQLATQREAERGQYAENLAFIEDTKRALSDQFKNLANDIMEEKARRFTEQNESNLGNLLGPLRQKLTEFQSKVEHIHVEDGKDRSKLEEQVRQLVGLNMALSEDAKNLASALKGSSKTQGNWGEMVLARVLESSGLREGHEYHAQQSHTQEDGRRLQPDIVVQLPKGRSLVIDSKVSLTAYEAHASADDEAMRNASLKEHLTSMRAHVRSLQKKQYQAMYQLETLDFVVMFVPVEPAFMLAANHGAALFKEAWDSGVLLVSPSTLMFVLRMVEHLWRQESRDRNAQDIAKRGAELYDKLSAFTADLAEVGTRLRQAQVAYDQASRKLSRGRGNVISQAEQLRGLGIQPTKSLNSAFSSGTGEDDGMAGTAGLEEGDAPEVKTDEGVDAGSKDIRTAMQETATGPGHTAERSPRPGSNLARAHAFVKEHIDTRTPADIRRMLAEQLELKPNVANTYFYQAKNALAAAKPSVE